MPNEKISQIQFMIAFVRSKMAQVPQSFSFLTADELNELFNMMIDIDEAECDFVKLIEHPQ